MSSVNEKINALRAKTPEAGATIEEACSAWRKAVELATRNGMSLQEAGLDQEPNWFRLYLPGSNKISSAQPADIADDDWMDDDSWTDWFRARLATNGGKKEIRKPTLKWKDVRPHLEDGPIEWLQVEIRRADDETRDVLSTVARSNSHGDYYLRRIILPGALADVADGVPLPDSAGLDRRRNGSLPVGFGWQPSSHWQRSSR